MVKCSTLQKNVKLFLFLPILIDPDFSLNILDPAAGASDDWYAGVLKARFAYTVELRDTGRHGFVLPANQIIPR
jgi:hypothetical protein